MSKDIKITKVEQIKFVIILILSHVIIVSAPVHIIGVLDFLVSV